MHRIVSLIASATEMTAALGCEEWLVGRSHECDYPRSVERLPICSEPRIDIHASSLEIDRQVKAAVADAVSIYRVKTDLLEAVRPSVILTQTQCEVCAVSLRDVELAVCGQLSSQPKIVPLSAMTLADVWDDVRRIGEALDVSARAEALISDCRRRLAEIQSATAELRPTRLACIEWLDPLMSAGNWVPELAAIAGGENLFGVAGEHSPWMTFGELLARDPEVIALMPCGFDIARTRAELPALTKHPDWRRLKAVQERRVYVTDGNQYFNRPGPRLVESAEILAELLHPQRFDFGHESTGWQRL